MNNFICLPDINQKRAIVILFIVISTFQYSIINSSAHEIRDIETIHLDRSPQMQDASWGTIPVVIEEDSTIVSLRTIYGFTFQHLLIGKINFSNIQLPYDGMEAYQTVLHQKIFIENVIEGGLDYNIELGSRSKKLSDSALHDGELGFVYSLDDLSDLTWVNRNWINGNDAEGGFIFRIENSIEFIRGTKQNARFDLNFLFERYIAQKIPQDYFHYKQMINSTVLPNKISVDQTSVIGVKDQVYLFLPENMIPRSFDSSDEHKLNLTKIPLTINLHLELDNTNNQYRRMFKVESGNYHGSPIDRGDLSEDFQLQIMLSDTTLIPISISSVAYTGEIKIKVIMEMQSLFADTGLYAKNSYLFTPNQYLLILSFIGTVFIYKLVDYVGYRETQNELARKNYGLVEKEFNR